MILARMVKYGKNKKQNIVHMATGMYTSTQIARSNKCSRQYVLKLRKETPSMRLPPRGGSRRKLDAETLEHLKLLFITNQLSSPRQAKNYLETTFSMSVGETTLRSRLLEMGLKCRKKKKRPSLTPDNMQERLEFARDHLHMSKEDWEKMLFVDESTAYTYDYFGNQYYWSTREVDESYQHIIETQKFRGNSFKLWAGVCGATKTRVMSCEGSLNSEAYIRILDQAVLPLWQNGTINQVLHDKCTSHKSKQTTDWLDQHGIKIVLLPTNSPDLNPIENVWRILKQKLSNLGTKNLTKRQLEESTRAQWNTITREDYIGIIHSMYERVRAVIKQKGGHTKY